MAKKKDVAFEVEVPQQDEVADLTGQVNDEDHGAAADAAADAPAEAGDGRLSTLEKIKRQAQEGDDAPSSSLRFRDVLGGEFLLSLVRRQAWLIILIVLITGVYVAVRYQCQQDAIDISLLEKNLINAKFEALSSSSNLTRMCRQSNVLRMLNEADSIPLQVSDQPPFIIEVPED